MLKMMQINMKKMNKNMTNGNTVLIMVQALPGLDSAKRQCFVIKRVCVVWRSFVTLVFLAKWSKLETVKTINSDKDCRQFEQLLTYLNTARSC